MTASEGETQTDESDWPRNYFNYFTEIEEHFQRVRGTGFFLLSPLDWALVESWKTMGVPLEAVIRGIDSAFEKWRARKQKRRMVNSLAYCAQAVAEAAQRSPSRTDSSASSAAPPFETGELRNHLLNASNAIKAQEELPFQEVAASLDQLAERIDEYVARLEDLERHLTALEEKLVAALRTRQSEQELYSMREALDRELRPYRGKMNAEQLAMLERRYLDTALLERSQLPRLSLFYLH
jgi:hypothetical protein